MSEDYAYFISDSRRRYVKIGVSKNPWSRLYDLQAGSPLRLKIDQILNFENRADALMWEDAAHQHFAEYWRHGEWFDYGPRIKCFLREFREGLHDGGVPRPNTSCKAMVGFHGNCLSKAEALSLLKDQARA